MVVECCGYSGGQVQGVGKMGEEVNVSNKKKFSVLKQC
jgi:hypothetical protein